MAKVKVSCVGIVDLPGGNLQLYLHVRDLSEVVEEMWRRYPTLRQKTFDPEKRELSSEYALLLDGQACSDYRRKLNDDDEVTILPVITGG